MQIFNVKACGVCDKNCAWNC